MGYYQLPERQTSVRVGNALVDLDQQTVRWAAFETDYRSEPEIASRWLSVDPIVQHSESPYIALDNNPILKIDPLGADPSKYYNNDGELIVDLNDGYDQSIEVNEAIFIAALIYYHSQIHSSDQEAMRDFTDFFLQFASHYGVAEIKGDWATTGRLAQATADHFYATDCYTAACSLIEDAGFSPSRNANNASWTRVPDGSNLEAAGNEVALELRLQLGIERQPTLVGLRWGPIQGSPSNVNTLINHWSVAVGTGNDFHGNYVEVFDNAFPAGNNVVEDHYHRYYWNRNEQSFRHQDNLDVEPRVSDFELIGVAPNE